MRCFLSCIVVLPVLGCAHIVPVASMPDARYEPTAEALWVDTRVVTTQSMEQVKVGDVQYTNADGSSAGSAAVYEDQLVTHTRVDWQTMQGARPIDDLHFYAAARDQQTVDMILAKRRTNLTLNRAGLGLAAAGLATLGASLAVDEDARSTVASTGVLAAAGGWYTAFFTRQRNLPNTHFTTPDHAAHVAERANSQASRVH